MTDEIDLRTKNLIKLGFKYYDALHLAFAEAENADIFLTTDHRLLRKAQQCQNDLPIKVENPIIWLMSILQNKGENHEN